MLADRLENILRNMMPQVRFM